MVFNFARRQEISPLLLSLFVCFFYMNVLPLVLRVGPLEGSLRALRMDPYRTVTLKSVQMEPSGPTRTLSELWKLLK